MTPEEEVALLGEVPVELEVELDRRIMTGRELLGLDVGSVIGTGRSAGENIDIYVGGVLCAITTPGRMSRDADRIEIWIALPIRFCIRFLLRLSPPDGATRTVRGVRVAPPLGLDRSIGFNVAGAGSIRPACSAGARPKIAPAATEAPKAKSRTLQSIETSVSRGRLGGSICSNHPLTDQRTAWASSRRYSASRQVSWKCSPLNPNDRPPSGRYHAQATVCASPSMAARSTGRTPPPGGTLSP